ncbi:LysR family transcriptional regulator [Pseudooceanicola sp.]|uniref:LysR family transcriptional regulator n=1 Tax=Pseudooceanicola sp. TaxID=1914328 RepID=UPI002615D4B9|nr:LysR family transcriptional regulator [Pseudooceanicola sp.]
MRKCMHWDGTTFDWNRARAFLVTAEEGSLSAAARALGLTQPTLGRQVEALQHELGVVLFERVGRGLTLTPAGRDLLTYVQRMGEAANQLSLKAVGRNADLAGKVVIAASEADAALILPAILADLRRRAPRISVQVVASSDTTDLLRREADIAIRNFRPTEPDLIARKIRDANARLYATPGYIDAVGPLDTRADLSRAAFVGLDTTGRLMTRLNSLGLSLSEANFPLVCDSFLVMWAMVKQGLGIGILDDRMARVDASVRQILPDLAPVSFPIWLVAHRDVLTNPRLRLIYDLLAEALA